MAIASALVARRPQDGQDHTVVQLMPSATMLARASSGWLAAAGQLRVRSVDFDMTNGVEPNQAVELLSRMGKATLELERTQ
jgi:hypothetical protein